jgi:hypothetical protein
LTAFAAASTPPAPPTPPALAIALLPFAARMIFAAGFVGFGFVLVFALRQP